MIRQTWPPDDEMELRRHVEGNWVVVAVSGNLDIATAPELEAALAPPMLPGGRTHVAVDASALTFCDSTGLNVLVRAWKRLRSSKGQLILMRVPKALRERLNWMGLDRILMLSESLPEAWKVDQRFAQISSLAVPLRATTAEDM